MATSKKENDRNYYQKNKEKIKAQAKLYYHKQKELNPEKVREHSRVEMRKLRQKNPEKYKYAHIRYKQQFPERYLYSLAKSRAKLKKSEFTIELSDIFIPEFCPLLGLKLEMNSNNKWAHPSLDRIDNSKGYIKGNIMVISFRANFLKNNASVEELVLLAHNLEILGE